MSSKTKLLYLLLAIFVILTSACGSNTETTHSKPGGETSSTTNTEDTSPKPEGSECDKDTTCATGLKCLGESESKGKCMKVITCTDEAQNVQCAQKGYEVCKTRKALADGSDVKVCVEGDHSTKAAAGKTCFGDDQCVEGTVCRQIPGSTAGSCEPVSTCSQASDCTADQKKSHCVEKETFDGNKIKVCEGTPCDAQTLCSGQNEFCFPDAADFSKGVCKEIVMDASTCSNEEKYTHVSSKLNVSGTAYAGICLPKEADSPFAGVCDHNKDPKVTCAKGFICIAAHGEEHHGACSTSCTKFGYSDECKHPYARYCGHIKISVPGESNSFEEGLGCGRKSYLNPGIKADVKEGHACNGVDTVCEGNYMCVKSKASDTEGKCYDIPDVYNNKCVQGSILTIATKDLILPYSDYDLEYCKK